MGKSIPAWIDVRRAPITAHSDPSLAALGSGEREAKELLDGDAQRRGTTPYGNTSGQSTAVPLCPFCGLSSYVTENALE